MAFVIFSRIAAATIAAGMTGPALAACPVELATYADMENAAELEFTQTIESATVTNSFRMLLGNDVVLDGVVMWTQGVARPNGMLMHECPEGDVTGAELDACTVWRGVIYTSDDKGNIGLLPAEGADAPQTLVLPDLAHSMSNSAVHGADGVADAISDVFALKTCQE